MEKPQEEECGICLDALENPVALPCGHSFCAECLNSWRPKQGVLYKTLLEQKGANGRRVATGDRMLAGEDRKCPLCREKIPPSKEMFTVLRVLREDQKEREAKGEHNSEQYMMTNEMIKELEHEIGDADATETIDYDKNMVLPKHVLKAAMQNDLQKMLDWLGPLPIDKRRINAKNPDMGFALVAIAMWCGNSEMLSILLQLGADVNSQDAAGVTPLAAGYKPERYAQARLLLEWGADLAMDSLSWHRSRDDFIASALEHGNIKLANLVKTEFGGRRCEIINLHNRLDLVGKICVVEKYLPDRGRYKVIFEASKEAGLVGPENLKRRDRTPDDCGYYIEYKNGRTKRREFASKEECQAFRASLMKGDSKSNSVDVDTAARSEQAAASLLADLNLEDSPAGAEKKGKARKKKGKKKGRKK